MIGENTVHIHHVLQMLSGSVQPCTETELVLKLKNTFGNDVKFLTCLDNALSPHEIVAFMREKGKVTIENELIYFVHGQDC